jgi:hypothetical protein
MTTAESIGWSSNVYKQLDPARCMKVVSFPNTFIHNISNEMAMLFRTQLRSIRPTRVAAFSSTSSAFKGAGKVPTPTMDTPEKKPDSVSNGNEPPPGFAESAPGYKGSPDAASGKQDLGLGKGDKITPPDPTKGEASASVGQQEFDSDGSDKRGDLGKTACKLRCGMLIHRPC